MNEYLTAKTRLIRVTGSSAGAGNTTITLRPDEGKLWVVRFALGWQASGGNRVANWWLTDPDTSNSLVPDITLVTSTVLHVGASAGGNTPALLAPIVLTRTRYLGFLWVATGAAEAGVVTAIVEEYTGVWPI
jgi:hypothetical protein